MSETGRFFGLNIENRLHGLFLLGFFRSRERVRWWVVDCPKMSDVIK